MIPKQEVQTGRRRRGWIAHPHGDAQAAGVVVAFHRLDRAAPFEPVAHIGGYHAVDRAFHTRSIVAYVGV
jgi:hypothetical protein